MRNFIVNFLLSILRLLFRLRYRIKVTGYEEVKEALKNKQGGVLFIPNHPAFFTDPAFIAFTAYKDFPLRPLVTDGVFYLPFVHGFMRFINALAVPDNESASNSLKKSKSMDVLNEVAAGLDRGENFLIYPSGRCTVDGKETLGGASGVHTILQKTKKGKLVLVRSRGIWGSIFTKAYSYETPKIGPLLKESLWILLKNFIFFAPRREIHLEFSLPAPDFPYHASRMEFNRYLERFYNAPENGKGEPLTQVSFAFWKHQVREPINKTKALDYDIHSIPDSIQNLVKQKIAEMLDSPVAEIRPEQSLAELGLDSLDLGELVFFLESTCSVAGVPVKELTSVGRVMGIAAGQIDYENETPKEISTKGWFEKRPHEKAFIAQGETIPEAFLNICSTMGNAVALADEAVGVMRYKKLKFRVLLLAQCIKKMPGKQIGIMLPSSAVASMLILAVQMAGKVPVMINWTLGPRHLQSVKESTELQHVLTAWKFINRLVNVDTTPLDGIMVMLEELRSEIRIRDLFQAYYRSYLSPKQLMKIFSLNTLKPQDHAVILFTSGTENHPKGVPLSYYNILSNQRSAMKLLDFYKDDGLLSILPPFHSFGFTVTSLMGILAGLKTAYEPNPTDGIKLVKAVEKWKVSLICGAPTFLRKLFAAAKEGELSSLRVVVTGAEKAPKELFESLKKLGKKNAVVEGYGITECSPAITINKSGDPKQGVGLPIEGVELAIMHPETKEKLPLDEVGTILVRGPNVFVGYLNKEQASPFVTFEGKQWYNTGDLGFLDVKGNLTISGRLKRFVKIGGEMISLSSIEHALMEAAVKEAWGLVEDEYSLVVCAKESKEGGEQKPEIHAFSVFKLSAHEMNEVLNKMGFSNLVKITHATHLNEIPMMGTGKINYRELQDLT